MQKKTETDPHFWAVPFACGREDYRDYRPGAHVPMVAPKQGRITAKQVPRPAEQPVEESQIQGAVHEDR